MEQGAGPGMGCTGEQSGQHIPSPVPQEHGGGNYSPVSQVMLLCPLLF